jgi:putative ABC transport system substrate-binding protein
VVAEELVRSRVELIVTNGTAATLAAKRATSQIPIVFDSAGDPVLLGLVMDLARPGGNVTGYSTAIPEVTSKTLSLLRELLPRLERVGVLQARNPYNDASRRQFEQVCRSLSLVPVVVEVEPTQVVEAVEALARRGVQALMFDDDLAGADEIVETATRLGLPTFASDHAMVRKAGALLAYSSTWRELWERRAEYVDRILRGARPADLPVQQPTRFELAINLKTAARLRLTVPQSLLSRADELVQ